MVGYYKDSLVATLLHLFPEIGLEKEKFPYVARMLNSVVFSVNYLRRQLLECCQQKDFFCRLGERVRIRG